jgi:hypothetical protein
MSNIAQPQWYREAGVSYRRDTSRFPIGRGESLLYYTWTYLPTGERGTDFVVVTDYDVRKALLQLLAHWNNGHPGVWHYAEGSL